MVAEKADQTEGEPLKLPVGDVLKAAASLDLETLPFGVDVHCPQ